MTLDVVATLGVPGSASTWAFNVVRELQRLRRPDGAMESFFSDAVERVWPVLRDNGHLDRSVVWKLHEPGDLWAGFLAGNAVSLVLTVRDPRDAMLSTMERFGEPKDRVFERVNAALKAVAESCRYRHVLWRYEDGFFGRLNTVAALAGYLRVDASQAEQARIFAAYQTDSVRRFAETLDTLPAHRMKRSDSLQYDETTQIHRSHIGDRRVGKWRDGFDRHDRADLTRRFRPFLEMFSYELD